MLVLLSSLPPFLSSLLPLSSLHVQSHAQTPPRTDIASSSSSVANLDLSESILIPEADAEPDTADPDTAVASARAPVADAASKKALRDHLRRTLSNKESHSDLTQRRPRRRSTGHTLEEVSAELAEAFPPRQYFVLTDAGKPVYTSRTTERDVDGLASTIGIMQALISVFLDDGDKLRCINAGNTRISFLIRSPLYYACVSSWGEPESVTRTHLEYLHLQVLSVVSAAQLRRLFERRGNFDLRRLLNGAEVLIYSLLERLQTDLAISTSSLHCLKLEPALRTRAANALVPSAKIKDVLYIILVAQGRVITLVRPRKHSIHPADLHLLMNTAHSPSIVNSSASASWLPLCLPKFDPSGFVNAYITFLQEDLKSDDASISTREGEDATDVRSSDAEHEGAVNAGDTSTKASRKSPARPVGSGVGLICVSGNGDFESIRTWCDAVTKRLTSEGTLGAIHKAIRTQATEYSVSELSIPGLRHFIYKSRSHVQITVPTYEDPYDDNKEQQRLMTLYQTLHDAIHAKSGQDLPLKLQYIRTERESIMGWITQPFELYIALSPWLPKSAAVGAANAVARWVKKEESRLFLRDAPVF
ncbi:hypothetical protein EVG20_g4361 [Dentipellis fragilis]|uniref:Vacuolar fusion protein MON1 n=1 Tax=Dentipellis fragilis TaxID=205917 RepID=A0A4Y9YYH4_9AGAM|nr:hypothetical protein EVG20_g4361 [Dentipellis fragilis]